MKKKLLLLLFTVTSAKPLGWAMGASSGIGAAGAGGIGIAGYYYAKKNKKMDSSMSIFPKSRTITDTDIGRPVTDNKITNSRKK